MGNREMLHEKALRTRNIKKVIDKEKKDVENRMNSEREETVVGIVSQWNKSAQKKNIDLGDMKDRQQ